MCAPLKQFQADILLCALLSSASSSAHSGRCRPAASNVLNNSSIAGPSRKRSATRVPVACPWQAEPTLAARISYGRCAPLGSSLLSLRLTTERVFRDAFISSFSREAPTRIFYPFFLLTCSACCGQCPNCRGEGELFRLLYLIFRLWPASPATSSAFPPLLPTTVTSNLCYILLHIRKWATFTGKH